MIGGGMLACAVGAMILIAWWSLPRDDDANPGTGLLALKQSAKRSASGKTKGGRRRQRQSVEDTMPQGKRDRRPDPSKRRRRR